MKAVSFFPRRQRAVLALFFAILPVFFSPVRPIARGEIDPRRFEVREDEPVWDESGYTSGVVSVRITSLRASHSDVYVCDIRIGNTDCFRRVFGGDKWNTVSERVGAMAERCGAVLAITGDSGAALSSGLIIGNGVLLRNTVNPGRDLCVLYRNGEMKTFIAAENDMTKLCGELEKDPAVWQVFLFGPALMDGDGHARASFNSNVFPANPRSVLGYYEKGHYCFVQGDGRGVPSALEKGRNSTGMNLSDLAAFMEDLGCSAAYNLDGGQSSALWFNGKIISTPYNNGRRVGDAVIITDTLAAVPGAVIP